MYTNGLGLELYQHHRCGPFSLNIINYRRQFETLYALSMKEMLSTVIEIDQNICNGIFTRFVEYRFLHLIHDRYFIIFFSLFK